MEIIDLTQEIPPLWHSDSIANAAVNAQTAADRYREQIESYASPSAPTRTREAKTEPRTPAKPAFRRPEESSIPLTSRSVRSCSSDENIPLSLSSEKFKRSLSREPGLALSVSPSPAQRSNGRTPQRGHSNPARSQHDGDLGFDDSNAIESPSTKLRHNEYGQRQGDDIHVRPKQLTGNQTPSRPASVIEQDILHTAPTKHDHSQLAKPSIVVDAKHSLAAPKPLRRPGHRATPVPSDVQKPSSKNKNLSDVPLRPGKPAQESQQHTHQGLKRAISVISHDSEDTDASDVGDTSSSFPEGFDRGRFPMYRRNRGPNKPKAIRLTYQSQVHRPLSTTSSLNSATPIKDHSTIDPSHQGAVASKIHRRATPDRPTIGKVDMPPQIKQKGAPTLHDPDLELMLAEITLGVALDNQNSREIHEADRELLCNKPHVLKGTWAQSDIQSGRRSRALCVLKADEIDPIAQSPKHLSRLLRHRECHPATRCTDLSLRLSERLEPWRYWKGASSDIASVSWSQDSTRFAVGACAHTNAEDLQYNRPCNLLFGSLDQNQMIELPDHRTERPLPETISQGPNAIPGTYNACDPMIYQTVNAVAFSCNDEQLYTASRDETLRIWDITGTAPRCTQVLKHDSVVTGLDVSAFHAGLFASTSHCLADSVRVYSTNKSDGIVSSTLMFSSSRAQVRPQCQILPECVRWGNTAASSQYLLAGFTQWEGVPEDDIAREGHLCLWDVTTGQPLRVAPSASSVTSIVWHPSSPYFASGGAPGNKMSKKRQTLSVVRVWDSRGPQSCVRELESPAQDIQDITFHPLDSNIMTAGCTDGVSYVWDCRWGDHPLHQLGIGLQSSTAMEETELGTGVCLSLWGLEGTRYYTGSSDGAVKAWDIRRSPEDAFIRDVAHVGAAVQTGAFSPDYSHMLVGDAAGAIHVLSSAPSAATNCDNHDRLVQESMTLIRAPDGSGRRLEVVEHENDVEGRLACKKMVESGEIEVHPIYGPGQGPMYQGPYAFDKRHYGSEDGPGKLHASVNEQQVYDANGELNREEAQKRKTFATIRRSMLAEAAAMSAKQDLKASKIARVCITEQDTDITTSGSKTSKRSHITVADDHGRRRIPRRKSISLRKALRDNYWWPRLGELEIQQAQNSNEQIR